jgi:hypothetical protein
MRRRGIAVVAVTGALLCLPTIASAQEAEPTELGVGEPDAVEREPAQDEPAQSAPSEDGPVDETGIGDADAVECRGTVRASVVDLDGTPVDGALLSVAGEQFRGAGSVDAPCGEVAASLLAAPDGYAPAGTTTASVPVRQAATSSVTFTVDPVEVLGTQFEQPEAPAPASTPSSAAPAPRTAGDAGAADAPELAATGREDAPVLLAAAVLSLLAGVALLRTTTPAPSRRA